MFVALVSPILVAQRGGTAAAADQERYHLPTIRQYSRDLPDVSLREAKAVMSPGHHLGLAVVDRYVSPKRVVLQAFAALLSLAFVLVVFFRAASLVGGWIALLLTLPLACSHYFLQSAGWLATDNAALLFVVLALFASLTAARRATGFGWAGVAAMLAVFIRQVHAWLAGVILLAGVAAARLTSAYPVAPEGKTDRAPTKDLRPIGHAALAVMLPILAVAVLVSIWGGLTPPSYGGPPQALRLSVFPLALALFGLFGTPYLVAAGQSFGAMARSVLRAPGPGITALVGGLIGLVPPTSESASAGRAGGIVWSAIGHTPVVAGRSLLLAGLAAWGGVVAVHWWRMLRSTPWAQDAVLLLVALLGLACAHVAQHAVYQRYLEPMVLVVLISFAAMAISTRGWNTSGPQRRNALAILAVLVAVQLSGAAFEIYRNIARSPPIEKAYDAQVR